MGIARLYSSTHIASSVRCSVSTTKKKDGCMLFASTDYHVNGKGFRHKNERLGLENEARIEKRNARFALIGVERNTPTCCPETAFDAAL